MAIPGEGFKPYVGVVGIQNRQEWEAVFDAALGQRLIQLGYSVMIGIGADFDTQMNNARGSETPDWYPIGDELIYAGANEDSGFSMTYVHYDLSGHALSDLAMINNGRRRSQNYSRGIQLNRLPWLTEDKRGFLDVVKKGYDNHGVILSTTADELLDADPEDVASRIVDSPVDYVAITKLHRNSDSGYRPDDGISTHVEAIRSVRPEMGISLAGHLNEYNLIARLNSFMDDNNNISFTAQSRMRYQRRDSERTVIGHQAVKRFMTAAHQLITQEDYNVGLND